MATMNAVTVKVIVPGVYSTPRDGKAGAIEADRGDVIQVIGGAYLDDVTTLGYVEVYEPEQPAQIEPEPEPVQPVKPQKRSKRNG